MQVTFRVLVSLTHSNQAWGRKVVDSECALGFVLRVVSGFRLSTSDIVKKEESEVGFSNVKRKMKTTEAEHSNSEHITHALDTLCLALGLLTNLVQVVDGIQDLLREFRMSSLISLTSK